MNLNDKSITLPEAKYLKSAGERLDVKVSYVVVDNYPLIHIRDFEFRTYEKACKFLKYISETEIVGESSEIDDGEVR